ncbi:hypothetical protein [Geobacter sp. SVR]|uniref:hypothetical protein n=1 Tax=Geobacter sp. SVR TaxID=2495594 RepID=UPI00143EF61D|nr:hypothetical protein [Geobacter sp. SVR]BCS52882.1 hypothetical protein GSVR_11900 [Geobacter sp. SVR]GCF87504.1 hypothetical protein GSbR_41040 [Geobacter sp. SVR]
MRERTKRSLWSGIMLVLAALVLFVPAPAPAKNLLKSSDAETRIAGKWYRSDGMYMLELGSARKGGTLAASYFNPRPIRVGRAVWRREQGRIMVVVELHDAHYPGSTYMLVYLPEKEKLAGYYYQAALGQTFEVQFRRK